MPLLFAIIATVVLSVVALLLFSIWGIPFVALAALILATYLIIARRGDSSVGTLEQTRRNDPTGIPRKGRGSAQTANERVGDG